MSNLPYPWNTRLPASQSVAGQVPTFTALRAITGLPANAIYFVAGRTVAGDGGGGEFFLDITDTTSLDNDGTILMPVSGIGRWKRVFSSAIDARWFGAMGDGLTTGDDARINAALAAAPAGADVVLSAGVFLVSTGVVIARGNVKLRGAGMGSTILQVAPGNVTSVSGYPEGNAGVLFSGQVSNVTVSDLSVAGSGLTPGDALQYQTGIGTIRNTNASGSNILVERCETYNMAKGIVFNTSAIAQVGVHDCRIHDIPMETAGSGDNTGYGLVLAGVRGADATGNKITRVHRHSIYQAATGRVVYMANTIEFHRQGDAPTSVANAFELARSQDVVLIGNLFLNNNATSLQLDPDVIGSGNPMRNVTISKNIFRDNLYAELVVGGDGATTYIPEGIAIEGNTFSRTTASNTQHFIYVQTGRHSRISGNQFWADVGYPTQVGCISFLGSSGGAFSAAQQACFTDGWEVSGNKGYITTSGGNQCQLVILSTNIAATASAVYQTAGDTSPLVAISGRPLSSTFNYGTVKITLSGDIGVGKFQYSLDNGATYNGADILIAASYGIPGTNLKLTFTAGAYVNTKVQSWVLGPRIKIHDNDMRLPGIVGQGVGLVYWPVTRVNPWITCYNNSPEDALNGPAGQAGTVRFAADVDATGGYRKTSRVYFTNTPAAAITNVAMAMAGATEGSANKNLTRPGRPGSITAIFIQQDAAWTAGICTVSVFDAASPIVDSDGVGTAVSLSAAALVDTATDYCAANGSFAAHYIPKDRNNFTAGAQLQAYITTNGAWPGTANVTGWFEYET